MIIGLILAGGLSSRMGSDKASLMIEGRTLLQRTAVALRSVGATIVAVSGDRAGGIPDRWPRRGPVGGIASAVEYLPDGELLVVPVDMPYLGHAVLEPLLAARSGRSVIWQGYPLPMRMALDATSRATLDELMTRPGRECSISALQARLGATPLTIDALDTRLMVNCNTPDEWREVNA
jgi:molybdopterin-guanine dinucleotide biosynthesis protein A